MENLKIKLSNLWAMFVEINQELANGFGQASRC